MTKKADKDRRKGKSAKPRVEKETIKDLDVPIKDLDVRKGDGAARVRGGGTSGDYTYTQSSI